MCIIREPIKFYVYEAFTEATRQVQAESQRLQDIFAKESAALINTQCEKEQQCPIQKN